MERCTSRDVNRPSSVGDAGGAFVRSRTVFVGGPIQHGIQDGVFDQVLRRDIEAIVSALDGAGFQVRSAHVTEQFGVEEAAFPPEMVARRDYAWLLEADVYVALLPVDADQRPIFSAGTCIELGWASARGLPILVLWDAARNDLYSHMIRGLHTTTAVRYMDLSRCLLDPGALVDALHGSECGGATDDSEAVDGSTSRMPHASSVGG